MNRTGRILAVTVGLMAGGALAGAVAAVLALMIGVAVTEHYAIPVDRHTIEVVAAVGATFGGVLFPAAGWIVLRRVALGLALLGTLLGTILGGSIGWVLPAQGPERVYQSIFGALAGFLAATILLRVTAGRAHHDSKRVSVN